MANFKKISKPVKVNFNPGGSPFKLTPYRADANDPRSMWKIRPAVKMAGIKSPKGNLYR